MLTHFSVVIPAHNERLLLPRALAAIDRAAGQVAETVEVVVVANRCTDGTAELAAAAGAVVIDHDARNIAAVRNAGAAVARGDVLLTIDADSVMAPNTLREIDRMLAAGRFVGGGTKVVPERRSAGILATYAMVEVLLRVTRLGGGMFWCRRSDFEAVDGFDESLPLAEDLDFAAGCVVTAGGPADGSSTCPLRPWSRRAASSTGSATGTCSGSRCRSVRSAP